MFVMCVTKAVERDLGSQNRYSSHRNQEAREERWCRPNRQTVLWQLVILRCLLMLAGVGRESHMEGKVVLPLYFPVSQLAALVGCKVVFF